MGIEIKEKIAIRLQQRVNESDEFKNLEEYVNYVLQQVVDKLEGNSVEQEPERMSKEDEEKIKENLRSLGYMD